MEVIVFAFPDGQLLFKIFKRIEFMWSIEIFIILSVAALYFAVVSGRVGANQLVVYSQSGQRVYKR